MTRKIIIFTSSAIIISLMGAWVYLTREMEISGEEFKKLVLESDNKSYSSWYLYFEDNYKYCVSYSGLVAPSKYCISKNELEIRNSKTKRESEIGYIGMNELVLKAGRDYNLNEEIF